MRPTQCARQSNYERYRATLERDRARLAKAGMSPHEEMTIKVEGETGTKSETWNMIDERWNRVTYLTKALLGIRDDKATGRAA